MLAGAAGNAPLRRCVESPPRPFDSEVASPISRIATGPVIIGSGVYRAGYRAARKATASEVCGITSETVSEVASPISRIATEPVSIGSGVYRAGYRAARKATRTNRL